MNARWFMVLALAVLVSATTAWAGMPKGICEKVFDPVGKERILSCKYIGGDRSTREIGGQQYIYDVGTCWDVDLVSLQTCGCRLFHKSSVCCRKGKSNKGDCEFRVGDSKLVDCKPFGQPAFGLSGDVEPEDCRKQRIQSMCWGRKDLQFGVGTVTGPCMSSPHFICDRGNDGMMDFLNEKCGPTPEACGCKLMEECSDPAALKCYKDWVANPEAVKCFDPKIHDNNYKRHKCYDALTGAK